MHRRRISVDEREARETRCSRQKLPDMEPLSGRRVSPTLETNHRQKSRSNPLNIPLQPLSIPRERQNKQKRKKHTQSGISDSSKNTAPIPQTKIPANPPIKRSRQRLLFLSPLLLSRSTLSLSSPVQNAKKPKNSYVSRELLSSLLSEPSGIA